MEDMSCQPTHFLLVLRLNAAGNFGGYENSCEALVKASIRYKAVHIAVGRSHLFIKLEYCMLAFVETKTNITTIRLLR